VRAARVEYDASLGSVDGEPFQGCF
jgi:hypothetical protein